MTETNLGYRRGERVEVKSLPEILRTLDAEGKLEGLPFMPEMVRHCGGQYRVYRRATKTCVEGLGIRRLANTVLLEGLRCNGAEHDGCQRACMLFWKEAWLRPCAVVASRDDVPEGNDVVQDNDAPSEALARLPSRRADRFTCQSTELPGATSEFPGGNFRHFLADFVSKDLSLPELWQAIRQKVANRLRRVFGRGLYKHMTGCQTKPSKGDLDLQPGEWVEVKSPEEIAAFLDSEGKNRGLSFEQEMLELCGRRFQVAFRVKRVIREEPGRKNSGKMIELANTVVLEGATCRGLCAKNCPRGNYFWWRESWLRRVPPKPPAEIVEADGDSRNNDAIDAIA